jgi:RNA polymerase primary sigma factor
VGKPLSLVIEEKYDQVRQLINMGKVRGYLLYDEVNDMLPAKVQSWEQIDDLLSTFELSLAKIKNVFEMNSM